MKPYIIGIRFQRVGKVYHFDASNYRDVQIGDFVVVETSRGKQLGEVVAIVDNPIATQDGSWKHIYRRATPRDLVLRQIWVKKETEAIINCRQKVVEIGLEGVKMIAAEFSFDGEKLTFLYCSEGDEKVELKKLRTVLRGVYPNTRIEMRQIGPRDVAKYLGGMGACGLETRCCSTFLTEFSPISIKMAKEQDISLTPTEITGMCGRLRCCLVYEYEQYQEARKSLPKRGKRVLTPLGEGRVIDVYPLKSTIMVDLDKGIKHEFPQEDVNPWEELEALKKKVHNPYPDNPNDEYDSENAESMQSQK
jgi:cell fate regulator YaaT (PSP1 superfamily)